MGKPGFPMIGRGTGRAGPYRRERNGRGLPEAATWEGTRSESPQKARRELCPRAVSPSGKPSVASQSHTLTFALIGLALPENSLIIPLLIADFGLWIAPQGVTVRSGTPTNAESSTGNGIISVKAALTGYRGGSGLRQSPVDRSRRGRKRLGSWCEGHLRGLSSPRRRASQRLARGFSRRADDFDVALGRVWKTVQACPDCVYCEGESRLPPALKGVPASWTVHPPRYHLWPVEQHRSRPCARPWLPSGARARWPRCSMPRTLPFRAASIPRW